MRLFAIIVLMIVVACGSSGGINRYENLMNAVHRYSRAIENKDKDSIHALTFQKSIECAGGMFAFDRTYDLVFFKDPVGLVEASCEFEMYPADRFYNLRGFSSVILVMTRTYVDRLGGTFSKCLITEDSFLAISDDSGKTFRFALINELDESQLQKIYRDFRFVNYGKTDAKRRLIDCSSN